MRRGWIAGVVCMGLGAGAWGCNAILGINDPIHAEETDAQPPADASTESVPDHAAPDNEVPDAVVQPDSDQPDNLIQSDQASPDGNVGPDASAPDASEPDAAQPDAAQPDAAQPDAPQPDAAQPDGPAQLQAREVGAGDNHSCAVMSDGTVRCWGLGFHGALGNNDVSHHNSPVQVVKTGGTPLAGATRVDGGRETTCALLAGGTVTCWGLNSSGEYGDGTTTSRDTADSSAALSGATDFSTGFEHVCAAAAGSAWCWGSNLYRKAGADQVSFYTKPHQIPNVTGVTAVVASYNHTCALHSGAVSCWGNNNSGQLGNNSNDDSDIPVTVMTCNPASPLASVQSIAAGARHTCALLANKSVWCWGSGSDGALGTGTVDPHGCATPAVGINNAEKLAAGTNHTCAISAGGNLWCWGYNTYGQIGDGFKDDVLLPNNVLDNVTSVAAGDGHTCAVKDDGTVWCWGQNGYGQLGTGDNVEHIKPAQVTF